MFAIIMIGALESCRSVKIHRTLSKSVIDSSASVHHDSTGTHTTTADYNWKKDSSLFESKKTISSNDFDITFDDTTSNQDPVIIKKENGSLTINPGNRKIKNIHVHTDSIENKSDSAHVLTSVASHTLEKDSSHVGDSSNTTLHKQSKEVDKNKTTTGGGVTGYAIVVLVVLLALVGYTWYRYNGNLITSKIHIDGEDNVSSNK